MLWVWINALIQQYLQEAEMIYRIRVIECFGVTALEISTFTGTLLLPNAWILFLPIWLHPLLTFLHSLCRIVMVYGRRIFSVLLAKSSSVAMLRGRLRLGLETIIGCDNERWWLWRRKLVTVMVKEVVCYEEHSRNLKNFLSKLLAKSRIYTFKLGEFWFYISLLDELSAFLTLWCRFEIRLQLIPLHFQCLFTAFWRSLLVCCSWMCLSWWHLAMRFCLVRNLCRWLLAHNVAVSRLGACRCGLVAFSIDAFVAANFM